ncbi:MAG: peptide chain release factor N(5)-glutamine methyltransferase [Planctomycetes bacterium]|nr:peptide chain release factor N(5)-glutamine methyltransferase [Planctomycetota bacterium]
MAQVDESLRRPLWHVATICASESAITNPVPPDQSTTPTTWTIGNLLTWTRGHFEKSGIDDARLCAELLLAKALGCKRIELYTRFEQTPTEPQRTAYRELVRAAAAHEPIAYLIGMKEFYSLEFAVTPDVLIPRPETELLVELALSWCKANAREAYDILDVGTGSGCIAVTLARKQSNARVIGCDISEPALAVAKQNAGRHKVANAQFIHADWLRLEGDLATATFDIIVSNPPYIARADEDTLPENVRKYEPALALFAPGDGLEMYRRLAADIADRLTPGGLFAVEVGREQADRVVEIFTATPLQLTGRHRDGAGIERALAFTLPA